MQPLGVRLFTEQEIRNMLARYRDFQAQYDEVNTDGKLNIADVWFTSRTMKDLAAIVGYILDTWGYPPGHNV